MPLVGCLLARLLLRLPVLVLSGVRVRAFGTQARTHTHELTDQRMNSRQSKIQFLSGLGFRVSPRSL